MDTWMVIIVIATTVVLMFGIPLMTMANRTDDVAQAAVDAAVSDFADTVATTGEITQNNLSQLEQSITASTGIMYDVQLNAMVLDENPGKEKVQANKDKEGENYFYNIYDTQLREKIESDNVYKLKKGDKIKVEVANITPGWSEQLMNSIFSFLGNENYLVISQQSRTVTK